MTTYTPGPWVIRSPVSLCHTWAIVGGRGRILVAEVPIQNYRFRRYRGPQDSAGDALLIAKTPDLLAVLCMTADRLRYYADHGVPDSSDDHENIAVLDAVQAVTREATGKAQRHRKLGFR